MLEHEPQQTEPRPIQTQAGPQSTADGVRVTAEEFSAAINALEQRRAEEAAHLAGTVEIGSTIRDLQIDATPDEVLREVEAQRARKAVAARAAAEARAASEAAAMSEARLQPQGTSARVYPYPAQAVRGRRRSMWSAAIGVASFIWFMSWIPSSHLFGSHAGGPLHGGASGSVITVSKMMDGQTVYADTETVQRMALSGGTINAADSGLKVWTAEGGNTWPVILHKGRLYLDGYTARESIDELGRGQQDIYNDNNSGDLHGESTSDVRVPLTASDSGVYAVHDGYSQITLNEIPMVNDDFATDKPGD